MLDFCKNHIYEAHVGQVWTRHIHSCYDQHHVHYCFRYLNKYNMSKEFEVEYFLCKYLNIYFSIEFVSHSDSRWSQYLPSYPR